MSVYIDDWTAERAIIASNATATMEFFLNIFTEFAEFAERAQPETSYVRDQDVATVPARHI